MEVESLFNREIKPTNLVCIIGPHLLSQAQNEGNQTYDLSDPDSERTVRMENLRYDIKSSQVEAFFRDYNPEHGSVKFMMHNGMPSGR